MTIFGNTLSLTMTVDELHRAWAKLDQLERQERYLVEMLSDIHKEIKIQKLKIDHLVKARPPTVDRLPTELLSQVFTLCIPDPKFPEKPLHQIVSVSRRWRDVVWNNPSFWTSIKVTPDQGKKLLKKQLKRSCKAMLDIWIEDWDEDQDEDREYVYVKFHALLDAIVPHANRWRSLIISNSMDSEFMESILTKISHLSIPFLKKFTMDVWDEFNSPPYLDFLSPIRVPALQRLTLGSPFQLDNFVAPPTLKTLYLTFAQAEADNPPPVISMLTPAQSLTSLILDDDSTGWSFKRNDLHSPLLEELTLYVDNLVPFLEAIVAPKLRYVQCQFGGPVEFNTIEGKFTDVHDISLEFSNRIDIQGAESLCRAFPGVHRVHLSAWGTSFFMAGIHGPRVLERRPPIDQWLNLKTVTLDGLGRQWLKLWELGDDPIVKWLRGRQESGLSRLRVKLPLIRADENGLIPIYYTLLERHCNLETFTSPT